MFSTAFAVVAGRLLLSDFTTNPYIHTYGPPFCARHPGKTKEEKKGAEQS